MGFGEGLRTNERPGTDHVTSELFKGVTKKTAPDGTDPRTW